MIRRQCRPRDLTPPNQAAETSTTPTRYRTPPTLIEEYHNWQAYEQQAPQEEFIFKASRDTVHKLQGRITIVGQQPTPKKV